MTNTSTAQYPTARKYDVNEEYANAERKLSEALLGFLHTGLTGSDSVDTKHYRAADGVRHDVSRHTKEHCSWEEGDTVTHDGKEYIVGKPRISWDGREIEHRAYPAPTWQTEPPTEAGWYPAIDPDGRMIACEVTLFEAHGGIMKYNNPVTISKFLKWWPIPITMPEPPEGI